jgi:Helix-turn-helix domain
MTTTGWPGGRAGCSREVVCSCCPTPGGGTLFGVSARRRQREHPDLAPDLDRGIDTLVDELNTGVTLISSEPPGDSAGEFAEREDIAVWWAQDVGVREIARRLGRSPSTISREVRRNASTRSYHLEYRASTAQWQSSVGHGGPRSRSSLRTSVFAGMRMRISHEAIYQALYVGGRGALKREVAACLRTGRAPRAPRARARQRAGGHVTDEVMISQRPAEAEDRAVPGQWEGDLIIGTDGRRSGPWWSARRGSRCCCTCRGWRASTTFRGPRTDRRRPPTGPTR